MGSQSCLWEHSVWWEGPPKQQCEDRLPDLRGGGHSEAELNKRLLAGLRELLRSVTSSLLRVARMAIGVSRHSCSDTSKERQIDVPGAKLSVTAVWLAVCRDLWTARQSRLSVVTPWCGSRSVSTANTGDHIIAGEAVEEPPELGPMGSVRP